MNPPGRVPKMLFSIEFSSYYLEVELTPGNDDFTVY